MEKLLADYLYQYKTCPLPGIGSLVLHPGVAKVLPGEKRMLAPAPYIELAADFIPAENLINFIAAEKDIRGTDAEEQLNKFCNHLQHMYTTQEYKLASAGSFYKDADDVLHFRTIPLPVVYFPEVIAERVIHPDVSHSILVGDTETTSAAMTELLGVSEEMHRPRWWIAAATLGLIGVIALLLYFAGNKPGGLFGNVRPVKAATAPETYTVPDK